MAYTAKDLMEEFVKCAKEDAAKYPWDVTFNDDADIFDYIEDFNPIPTKYGIARQVDKYGGEGMGEQYYIVWEISDGSNVRFFRADGYYASWDGHNWDDAELYEVKPKQVTKTEYVRKEL